MITTIIIIEKKQGQISIYLIKLFPGILTITVCVMHSFFACLTIDI